MSDVSIEEIGKTAMECIDRFAKVLGTDEFTALLTMIEYFLTLNHRFAPMETEEYLEALLEHYQAYGGFPKHGSYLEARRQLQDILRLVAYQVGPPGPIH